MAGVEFTSFSPPSFSFVDNPYLAANFGATAAMTWTVDLADQVTFRYAKQGRMMAIWLRILNTTVGGVVAGGNPTIKIPESRTSRNEIAVPFLASPGGGATEGAILFCAAGSNLLLIQRYAANWVLGANNTDINGFVMLELS